MSINSPSVSLPSWVIAIISPTFKGCRKKRIRQAVMFVSMDISAKSATPNTVNKVVENNKMFSCFTLQIATMIINRIILNKSLKTFKTSFCSVFLKYEFFIVNLTKYIKIIFTIKKLIRAIIVSII